MEVQINWVAVLLAGLSSMVVGGIWYSKSVFGPTWAKLVKIDLDSEKTKKAAGPALAMTLVVSFITAYVLAHVVYLSNQFFGNSFLSDALTTGFWLWLGFIAARVITHDAFEQRPMQLTFMNILHELVTIEVMALIIGSLKP